MSQAPRDQNFVPTLLGVSNADGATPVAVYADPVTHRLLVDLPGGSGSVSNVSVTSANGFAGTVANPTSTPAITISTTVTGILEGNGTAVSAASTTGTGAIVLANSPTFTDDITLGANGGVTGSILFKGVTSGTVTVKPADVAGTWTLTLPATDGNAGEYLQTDGSGTTIWAAPTAGTITVANEATDTSCFLGFFTAATGDLQPKTNANLTFDSATGILTAAQTISGSITGNAGTVTFANEATDTTCFIAFATAASGALAPKTNANMTFNSNTGVVTFASSVLTTTDINGGTIDGASIGATSPATGVFTTHTSNNLLAASNDVGAIGASGTAWSDLFLASGGVINWNAGDYTLTHSAGILTANKDFRITSANVGTNADSVPTLSSTSTLTNKTLTSPTITTPSAFTTGGTITLAENTSIALDPAGSADGKYTGITVTGTAGYTQAFGDLVYLDPTDSRWEAADANAASGADGDARGMLGMVVSAGTDGTACTILLNGIIRADAKFPTFTVNNPIYVSETAGSVTQTQPTTTDVVIRIVGSALTADEMYFNPDWAWITHT